MANVEFTYVQMEALLRWLEWMRDNEQTIDDMIGMITDGTATESIADSVRRDDRDSESVTQ